MADSERARTVREAYQAFNRGELDAVLDLFDEEVEWSPPPNSPEPQPLKGREAVRHYLAPDLFEEQTVEPQEILERDDRILVVGRARARGRESRVEIDQTVFHLWTVAGGRAVSFVVHTDREQAFAALEGGSG